MTPSTRGLTSLLDRLRVPRSAVVYLHTSFSRLGHLELSPAELIEGLLQYLGPEGTLVMPSFAWHLDASQRPWKGYQDYYLRRPVFDVRRTAANIGIVPETFRQRVGVVRSASYWWSVTAEGPLAQAITEGQENVIHPYGPGSSFARLQHAGVWIVGLGVTLNTTSLAPVADWALADAHPQRLMSQAPEDGVVIDASGRRLTTRSYWLLPDVVRCIKPSVVFERSPELAAVTERVDHQDVIQFAYPFSAYFSAALQLASALPAGAPVPWLEEYPIAGSSDRVVVATIRPEE